MAAELGENLGEALPLFGFAFLNVGQWLGQQLVQRGTDQADDHALRERLGFHGLVLAGRPVAAVCLDDRRSAPARSTSRRTTGQPATMLSATWRCSHGLRGQSIGPGSRRVLSAGQVWPVLEQKDSGERAPKDDSDQLRASRGFCCW